VAFAPIVIVRWSSLPGIATAGLAPNAGTGAERERGGLAVVSVVAVLVAGVTFVGAAGVLRAR
jgi:hypothetical protein